MILKREVLIEEIADNAAEEIVGGRGDPVAQMEDIIEHKHDGRTHYRVDHTNHHKLHESLVSEQSYLIF